MPMNTGTSPSGMNATSPMSSAGSMPAPAPTGPMGMGTMDTAPPPAGGPVPMTMPAGSPMPHMGSMHGYFFGGPGFYYLFGGWFVSTTPQLVGACLGTAAAAAALTVLRGTFLRPLAKGEGARRDGGAAAYLAAGAAASADALLHYVLMLVAMTYSVWILVALVVGMGAGQVVNLVVISRKQSSSGGGDKGEEKSGDDGGVEHGCH
ncbi:hypothetical protein THAOC_04344 [Thalassiosira oceanica]|uniref:Copper transport protein n=1 Tax=Thalassiosira oceanica TaxID=159749 RepID=K0T8Y2_THAOC|nr:hypothetical protein THAOC_04344 [Thalassiosira oceanica]|eukprot:EJK74005.1 hypothetical protein THAOC_04344 [Thalassiosira oceanica]